MLLMYFFQSMGQLPSLKLHANERLKLGLQTVMITKHPNLDKR